MEQPVVVKINGEIKFSATFEFIPTPPPEPVFNPGLTPSSGGPGTSVRITGSNIPQSGVEVTMGGVVCQTTVDPGGTFIDFIVPNLPA